MSARAFTEALAEALPQAVASAGRVAVDGRLYVVAIDAVVEIQPRDDGTHVELRRRRCTRATRLSTLLAMVAIGDRGRA